MTDKYFIGALSGTSMDAIDIAAACFSSARPQLLACASYPIPPDLIAQLRRLQSQPCRISELVRLDYQCGKLFADSLNDFMACEKLSTETIAAIGLHGQTILHEAEASPPLTLQIGNPSWVAHHTGIAVVADFRHADIAAGGQGAPLAPALHALAFGKTGEPRLVVNIGGIANVTALDGTQVLAGFDTGPGNCLMDAWSRLHRKQALDRDGQWAAAHKPDANLLDTLLKDSFFQKAPPKSTCTNYFSLNWLEAYLTKNHSLNLGAVAATLAELTALSIANTLKDYPNNGRLLVCGGGVHNTHLMQRLKQHTQLDVISTTEVGLDADWVEAILMAWLAKQRLENRSSTLPATSGARAATVLGALYQTRCKD